MLKNFFLFFIPYFLKISIKISHKGYEVCSLVKSIQGNSKIIVHKYILVKEKNKNKRYYWYCKYRKKYTCNGRVITNLEDKDTPFFGKVG